MGSESRALEIAKAAIQKVFMKGGETTVTLPKFWAIQILVTRTILDVTELEVRLANTQKEEYESIFLKRLSTVIIDVFESHHTSSIVSERATMTVTVRGRFKLSVMYLTRDREAVTADIMVKKV
jgi:hypothetical protein